MLHDYHPYRHSVSADPLIRREWLEAGAIGSAASQVSVTIVDTSSTSVNREGHGLHIMQDSPIQFVVSSVRSDSEIVASEEVCLGKRI